MTQVTASTPHHSTTTHDNELEAPLMTPEAKVKDLGGTVQHLRRGTVAKFHDLIAAEYFYEWLASKNNYYILDFNGGAIFYCHLPIKKLS